MSALAEGVYFVRNVAAKTVITVNPSASPNPTLVGYKYDFDKVDQQLFSVKAIGKDNKYLITHVKTGLVFDLQGAKIADLTPIIVYPVHWGDNQLWNIKPSG
jgi:hypothetical protein